MQTVTELIELIRRGAEKPTTVALEVIRTREPESHFGWVTQPTFFLPLNATGLTVHHSAIGVHALRGKADVVRGSGAQRWVFEGREVPALIDVADLQTLGIAGFFLKPAAVIKNMNLSDADLSLILQGEIAGRSTWVIPSAAHSHLHLEDHPRLIEVDQEHGTLLAVESDRERIEATNVAFPSAMSDPAWEGTAVDWKEEWDAQLAALKEPIELPAAEDLPGFFEQLPPQSADLRRLRIWIGDGSLEGSYPRYKVGESVRLPLAFRRGEPPLPGLETTRRGWIRHLDEPGPPWPVIFTGDGWSTYSDISAPVDHEAELQGWFGYAAWDPETVWNDVKVERIFGGVGGFTDSQRLWQELEDTTEAYNEGEISLRDVILDVTLDGVTPPPLVPEQFQTGSIHVVDDHLWVLDYRLPVLRCWQISTGQYLGQSFVPVSLSIRSALYFSEDVIHNAEQAWVLVPGSSSLPQASSWNPPSDAMDAEVPAPWEIMQIFPDRLFSLVDFDETSARSALGRVNSNGAFDICVVHTDGTSVGDPIRIGERYFLHSLQTTVVIGPDFRVESVEHHEMGVPPWSWFTSKGVVVSSAGPELIFLNQDSGIEITRWTKPANHNTNVEIISPSKIIVAIRPEAPQPWLRPAPTALALFDDNQWSSMALESSHGEI